MAVPPLTAQHSLKQIFLEESSQEGAHSRTSENTLMHSSASSLIPPKKMNNLRDKLLDWGIKNQTS